MRLTVLIPCAKIDTIIKSIESVLQGGLAHLLCMDRFQDSLPCQISIRLSDIGLQRLVRRLVPCKSAFIR